MSYLFFIDMPIVTLVVAQDQKTFNVHEGLLCDASPVFHASFKGNFAEAQAKTMQLPESDTSVVEDMLKWLYTRKLRAYRGEPCSPIIVNYCWELAKLSVFADVYNMIELGNAVVDVLYDALKTTHRQPLTSSSIDYVYQHFSETSPFRTLLVAWYAWRASPDWYMKADTRQTLLENPEFSIDIVIAFAGRLTRNGLNPLDLPKSEFHEEMPKAVASVTAPTDDTDEFEVEGSG